MSPPDILESVRESELKPEHKDSTNDRIIIFFYVIKKEIKTAESHDMIFKGIFLLLDCRS